VTNPLMGDPNFLKFKKVLGEKSPLFGRRSGQILLKSFSYLEAGQFHPSWSFTDKAEVFSICCGIPYYLKFFFSSDSLDINTRKNFLNEFSALARDPELLLRDELKELKKYFGILTALSTGAVTNQEMAEINCRLFLRSERNLPATDSNIKVHSLADLYRLL